MFISVAHRHETLSRDLQVYNYFHNNVKAQSGWLLSKSLQAINAGEDVEKREPSYTVDGKQTSTATMENSVEIP